MTLVESLLIFSFFINIVLCIVVTAIVVKTQAIKRALENLTKSFTAQMIASGTLGNQQQQANTMPQSVENNLVS